MKYCFEGLTPKLLKSTIKLAKKEGGTNIKYEPSKRYKGEFVLTFEKEDKTE